MSNLVIDISHIAGTPGAVEHIVGSEHLAGLNGTLGWVEESDPIEMSLLGESVERGIAVSGDLAWRMHLSCSRCLTEYEEDYGCPVNEMFYFERGEERGGYQVRSNTIDLEPMLRDIVILSIPTYPVHSPGCRGLCPACGADRNVTRCGHEDAQQDPRWAALAHLAHSPSGDAKGEEV